MPLALGFDARLCLYTSRPRNQSARGRARIRKIAFVFQHARRQTRRRDAPRDVGVIYTLERGAVDPVQHYTYMRVSPDLAREYPTRARVCINTSGPLEVRVRARVLRSSDDAAACDELAHS